MKFQTLAMSFQSGWPKTAPSTTIFRHLNKYAQLAKAPGTWQCSLTGTSELHVRHSTFSEKGSFIEVLKCNSFALAKQKRLGICALVRSNSMVHPGWQSVQLRDEEIRNFQAKLWPCNSLMAYACPYKAIMCLEKSLVQRKATFWQKRWLAE